MLAATNKNLMEEIKKGNFREDLYYRLNTIEIKVPALRDRKEDIPLLVEYFNSIICEEQGCAKKKWAADAIKTLQERDWRGNIRELRNIVERLIILSGNQITKEELNIFA